MFNQIAEKVSELASQTLSPKEAAVNKEPTKDTALHMEEALGSHFARINDGRS